ncbi:hypothetical protein OUZ56_000827 [Daphnia magna]|uniref:Uncharacterized protein n=1 Tax=Daphnia magna TaxID=35525 RepID=A0ABR0A0W1_9CRUS|nr:hypothetical protein OUZ56_000827 [Daphnia magna]
MELRQIQHGYRAVKHPALPVFHKCENLICVQVGLLWLQRLMEKPSSSPEEFRLLLEIRLLRGDEQQTIHKQ